jgi:hypothetical protein
MNLVIGNLDINTISVVKHLPDVAHRGIEEALFLLDPLFLAPFFGEGTRILQG